MSLTSWLHWFKEYFIEQGMSTTWATALNILICLSLLFAVLLLIDFILRKFIIQAFKLFTDKTKTSFDDFLAQSNFPRFIAHIIPVLVMRYAVDALFVEFDFTRRALLTGVDFYLIILGALIFRSLLRSTRDYLETKPLFKDKPLDSYIQVLMIFIWALATYFMVYRITGDFAISVSTFGATSALVLLIFKDTILGFIASVQITVNDTVRIGDWITVEKYGADGVVNEINLATVKVQNFDNTYTTIPTYSLIADSFQNWRGMQESDGRRIKRSLYIKQNSVRFIEPKDLEQFKSISLIAPYIDHRQAAISKANEERNVDTSLIINGRQQTNLGVFRKYIDAYLNANNAINKDMFLMVRHLEATPQGIPLQVYCFSYDKEWVNYEYIQADIFDHLIAAVKYFDLEIYEYPSGQDFKKD